MTVSIITTDIIVGAVSSSGPLNAKLDYFEYFQVVEAALATTGPGCNEAITEAIAEFEAFVADNQAETLGSLFKTCNPVDLSNKQDVDSLLELLIDNLAGVVQYNGR